MKERDCANCKHHSEDGCSKWDCEFEAKMPKGELISKADAIELLTEIVFDEPPYFDSETLCRLYAEEQINKLPSAELTLQTPQTYGKSINPSNAEVVEDLISRADAMAELREWVKRANENGETPTWNDAVSLIGSLPSAEAEPKMTEEVREALMRLTMCAREECDMCKYKDKCGFEFQYNISTENMNTILDALSAEADGANLINRHDAVTVIREECWKCNNMINDDLFMRIMSLPTSRQTDCTEFIMWLVEVVLDDEDWELNAVAYGEVIARKLKKLGLLEVKDGYYIRHTAHRPKGEWIFNPKDAIELMFTKPKCSECGFESSDGGNFCSNCGARMKEGAE